MATLLGQKINATYDSLLKTEDNDGITGSLKQITDGVGQTTPLYLSTTEAKIGGNLEITGDLTVGGTTTYINTDNVTVKDGLVLLANDNVADIIDIGLYGKYNDGTVKYTGLYRDATDGVFKIFDGLATEPTTIVGGGNLADFAAAGGSFSGNLIVDGNYYSTDGAISLTNGDIVTGGHIAINSGNAPTSFSSNANQLIVGGADSGTNQGMTIASDSGATGNIFFADGITGDQQYRGLITYNHSSDTMYLGTAAANRISIASDGTFTKLGSTGNITLNDGGYKIDFSQQGIIEASGVGAYLNLIADGVMGLYASQLSFSRDSGITTDFIINSSGNGGLGTPSPSAKFHVASSTAPKVLIQDTGGGAAFLSIQSGATSQSNIYLGDSADENAGAIVYNNADNSMSFRTNGFLERMVIDSAGDVIIGKDGVAGTLRLKRAAGGVSASIYSSGDNLELDASLGSMIFKTNSTTAITIDSSQNVLLSGGGYLSTNVVRDSALELMLQKSGTTLRIGGGGVSDISTFYAGGSERMRIDSSGNVGIGTQTLGGNKLRINDATGAKVQFAYNDVDKLRIEADSGGGSMYAPSGAYIRMFTSGSERMRITSGGYLKASNTGVYLNSTSAYHELDSNDSGSSAVVITHTHATSPNGLILNFSAGSPDNTTQYFMRCQDSTTNKLLIYSNGNVVNSNNSYGAISDIKHKENIEDATPKLDDLMQVKIRNYNLIGEETKQLGVVAQELEEVFPSMIDESADFEEREVELRDENGEIVYETEQVLVSEAIAEELDADGNIITPAQEAVYETVTTDRPVMTTERVDLGTTTKSVKYSVFVPMLIKAIQELKAEVDALKGA